VSDHLWQEGDMTEIKEWVNLSEEQWQFLAVLAMLKVSVSIKTLGLLVPLQPGPLFDLLNRGKEMNWIIQDGKESFRISHDISPNVKAKLKEINDTDYILSIVKRLKTSNLYDQIDPKVMIKLLEHSGLDNDIAEYEIKYGSEALKSKDIKRAWVAFKQATERLYKSTANERDNKLFLYAVLNLSNLSFIVGKGFDFLPKFLNKGYELAEKLGDDRSSALINLHLGRLYYFSDRRSDASVALSVGLGKIRELGDPDILDQSAEFFGLFYYMHGEFREAFKYLEHAEHLFHEQKTSIFYNPTGPFLFGYCLTYLGEFHRAIGNLDFNWRIAREQSRYTVATTLRAILGTVLLLIGEEEEAEHHLKSAIEEAKASDNLLALHLAYGGLALKMMQENHIVQAYECLRQAMSKSLASGLARQYSSPWILEMIFEFEKLGLDPIPTVSFKESVKRAFEDNNIHLQGVIFRLLVKRKQTENKNNHFNPMLCLLKSQRLLERSGDRIQLAKTIIEMARLETVAGNIEIARKYAKRAWRTLGEYANNLFPNELRSLIQSKKQPEDLSQEFYHHCTDLINTILSCKDEKKLLSELLVECNRFFNAERGGLFRFIGDKSTKKPDLIAGCNLSKEEIASKTFQLSRAKILEAYTKNKTILVRINTSSNRKAHRIKVLLCLPLESKGEVRDRDILYFDNTYLKDCFDFLDPVTIKQFTSFISKYVKQIREYCLIKNELDRNIQERLINQERSINNKRLVYQSLIMEQLLEKARMVAKSDSTILILGETGVGKELLAQWIHKESNRGDRPFITINAPTIPENLMESELFGHEKGAFTGADRQKKGIFELAHGGTLFIDEIGEIPKFVQAKLLRVLQEHVFYRVGGTYPIKSDFRLITATNRDIAEEVSVGNFREDLYYRLNVITLLIPPLRDRVEDIPLLAQHFLELFRKKYNRPFLLIDRETEAKLKNYSWPGNIRELENVIERSVLLSSGPILKVDLPPGILDEPQVLLTDNLTLDEVQRRYIKYVLRKTNGKISGPGGATEILGIKRTTLYARMKKLGLIN